MNNNLISVDLNIKSELLDPDVVSNLLQIRPTHSFKKGDFRQGVNNSRRTYGGWSFRSCDKIESKEISVHFQLIEELILNQTIPIDNIREMYSDAEIWIEIDFDRNEDRASLFLSSNVLSKLSQLVDVVQISNN